MVPQFMLQINNLMTSYYCVYNLKMCVHILFLMKLKSYTYVILLKIHNTIENPILKVPKLF